MTFTRFDREKAGFDLIEHLARHYQNEWVAIRVQGEISWNIVRPRTEGALLASLETEGFGKDALRERLAQAFIDPLGYAGKTLDDAEHIWVGNNIDDVETGSLAYLCRALADAALASADTHPKGGDSVQHEAPSPMSGAVPEGQTPTKGFPHG
jgi:hypothetical protein